MKNYYKILNLSANASSDDIKSRYRALAKQYHPDTHPDDAKAAALFADINEAYDVLGDSVKRAEYDKQLQAENTSLNERTASSRADDRYSAPRQNQSYAQAQFQAHVQAAVNQQVAAVRNQAFKMGYDRGKSESKVNSDKIIAKLNAEKKALADEIKRLKTEINNSERNRRDLEQKIFDRDNVIADKQSLEHKYSTLMSAVETLGAHGYFDDDRRLSEVLSKAQLIAVKSGSVQIPGADDGETRQKVDVSEKDVKHSKRIGKTVLENIDLLKTAAIGGDPDAQNELGKAYYFGLNTKRDLKQAVYWFKEAVKKKHFGAMYNLGVCFVNGDGVNKNDSVGSGYIRQAEQLGNVVAKRVGKRYAVI